MPDQIQAGDAPGPTCQGAPAPLHVLELHYPRRPSAVAPAPARNGLPDFKPYVYRGTGYDQFPDLRDDEQ